MNLRSLYRITAWTSFVLGILSSLYVVFIENNAAIVFAAFVSFACAAVQFFGLIPETYKRHEIHRYKKWHVIHGYMDERVEIKFDERKIPLN